MEKEKEGGLSKLMSDKKYKQSEDSRFQGMVRIDKKQLKYLKNNKKKYNCKTMAGYLDKIINYYKKLKIKK